MKAARGGTYVSHFQGTDEEIDANRSQGKGIAAYAELLEDWRRDGNLAGFEVVAAS